MDTDPLSSFDRRTRFTLLVAGVTATSWIISAIPVPYLGVVSTFWLVCIGLFNGDALNWVDAGAAAASEHPDDEDGDDTDLPQHGAQ